MTHEIKEPQRYVMPFGKYKGEFLGDIPKSYLIWMMDNLDLRQPLKDCVKATVEMMERSGD
jgi:hypothetical protein